MNRDIVIVFPYVEESASYISMMQEIIKKEYRVLPYASLKSDLLEYDYIKAIYLNWFENNLDLTDKAILEKAKQNKIKVVWTFHNRIPHDTKGDNSKVDNIRFLMEISDIIILHSKESIEYLLEYGLKNVEKCKYIPHPEYINNYGKLSSYDYSSLDNSFVFGQIGFIRPYKNIEVSIEAFKLINNENIKLLIMGEALDKTYLTNLKVLIGDDHRIILCDRRIPDFEMAKCLMKIDVMLLPYNKDSSMNSGALLMVGSYKKTAIITDIAMANDFPDDCIYKYSFDDESEHVKKIKEKMESAYNDRGCKLERKGDSLHEYIKDYHSKELVFNLLLECFE